MFLEPGNGTRSTRSTVWPARARTVAAHDPAVPAPTTTESYLAGSVIEVLHPSAGARPSVGGPDGGRPALGCPGSLGQQPVQFVENAVGIAHHRQVGHLHHRAVRIGVHADDVSGIAEPGGVLHRAAD